MVDRDQITAAGWNLLARPECALLHRVTFVLLLNVYVVLKAVGWRLTWPVPRPTTQKRYDTLLEVLKGRPRLLCSVYDRYRLTEAEEMVPHPAA